MSNARLSADGTSGPPNPNDPRGPKSRPKIKPH
jgi:hypothetical protein